MIGAAQLPMPMQPHTLTMSAASLSSTYQFLVQAWKKSHKRLPRGGLWHMSFHGVRDLPEILVAGKRARIPHLVLSGRAYNPTAIEEEDIDEYVRCYAAPGGMRAGFEVLPCALD